MGGLSSLALAFALAAEGGKELPKGVGTGGGTGGEGSESGEEGKDGMKGLVNGLLESLGNENIKPLPWKGFLEEALELLLVTPSSFSSGDGDKKGKAWFWEVVVL